MVRIAIPSTPRMLAACLLAFAVGVVRQVGADTEPNMALDCSPQQGTGIAVAPGAPSLVGALTIEAWVNASPSQPYSTFPVILAKPAGDRTNGEMNYGFVITAASGNLDFRVTTSSTTARALWSGNIMDGTWHHIAGVRTTGGSDQLLLYLDNALVATAPITGNDTTSTDPLCIGGLQFSGYDANRFKGQIDEVRIWNVARTSLEISQTRYIVFNWEPGLLADWHFDHLYRAVGPSGCTVYFLESTAGVNATPAGDIALVPSGLSLSRGGGITVDNRIGTDNCNGASFGSAAALANGYVVTGETSELDVMSVAAPGPGSMVSQIPLTAPGGTAPLTTICLGSVARANSVFYALEILGGGLGAAPDFRLFDADVSDPTSPRPLADSLAVDPVTAMQLDPGDPNTLFLGFSGGQDLVQVDATITAVSLVDSTNMSIILDQDLGPSVTALHDLAKEGAYVYASFDDSLRVYHYYQTLNTARLSSGGAPHVLARIPGAWDAGPDAALGVFKTYLYAASRKPTAKLSVYDLSVPTAPAFLRSIPLDDDVPSRIAVQFPFAYVTGLNGVHVVYIGDPPNPFYEATYCTDAAASGIQAIGAQASRLGLSAGPAGFYVLTSNVYQPTAVDPDPRPAGSSRLIAAPNPTRGTTRVAFALPTGGRTRIALYDVSGREVRVLADAELRAGPQQFVWDGRDSDGRAVASGVYLCRIAAGGETTLGSIAVIR